jgi:protein involved in polysaccharide export with SLBB domain
MIKSILVSTLSLCFAAFAGAQDIKALPTDLGSLESMMRKTEAPTLPQASIIEHAVDATQYILGPGDVLQITLSGPTEINYSPRVSPEGSIQIPSVGSIDVNNLTLAEAKEKLAQKIKGKYLSNDLFITLIQLRAFRVTVSGAVFNPGIVTVNALNRVSEAIDLCGGFIKPIQVRSETKQIQVETPVRNEMSMMTSQVKQDANLRIEEASQRNIQVKRGSGQILKADIQKYRLTGDLESNPYLLDGDVIFVPTMEKMVRQVWINGAVKAPDKFELANGDRIRDLIALAHGFSTDADSSQIELVRFTNKATNVNRTVLQLDWQDSTRLQQVLDTPLLPDDRLYVRPLPQFHEKLQVEIVGQVRYPGMYALENKTTTLSQIIERAGGFTREASLQNSYVVRGATEDVLDPEYERLKKMTITEMTEMEREYFKIKSRERVGGMGIDFVALFVQKDNRQDAILRDKDLIVVPSMEMTVKVSGQVMSPGLLPYEANRTLRYYIQKAGGYNWNVRKSKIRVIKGDTGEWIKPSGDTIIDVGDTIFIPEKPERDFWALARDLITVTAQLATIYLVIQQASE